MSSHCQRDTKETNFITASPVTQSVTGPPLYGVVPNNIVQFVPYDQISLLYPLSMVSRCRTAWSYYYTLCQIPKGFSTEYEKENNDLRSSFSATWFI